MQNPNTSQWNIGPKREILALGMYFLFCVLISFVLGSVFSVEYGLYFL